MKISKVPIGSDKLRICFQTTFGQEKRRYREVSRSSILVSIKDTRDLEDLELTIERITRAVNREIDQMIQEQEA
jgi:hypothetical protein